MDEPTLTSPGAGLVWALVALVLLWAGWDYFLPSVVAFFLAVLAAARAQRAGPIELGLVALLVSYAAAALLLAL